MTSPAASLRGGAVGALTVALAVAAHGTAGGAYPSGSALTFLMIVGIGVGAVSMLPSPSSGRAALTTVLGGLVFGQFAGHLALAVAVSGTSAVPHEAVHAHSVVPSTPMLVLHLAASVAAAALICVAEQLYGPITSIIRAVLRPPLTLPVSPIRLVTIDRPTYPAPLSFTTSISRRGPPASA